METQKQETLIMTFRIQFRFTREANLGERVNTLSLSITDTIDDLYTDYIPSYTDFVVKKIIFFRFFFTFERLL